MSAKPPDPPEEAPKADPPPAPAKSLPEANEFSPGQVTSLRKFLQIVKDNAGDRDEIIEAVRQEFFKDTAPKLTGAAKLKQGRTRAYNAVLGGSKYGVVNSDLTKLTPLGTKLLKTSTDRAMFEEFARHIIRELNGFDVLVALREMKKADDRISKTTLQEYLEQRAGFEKLPRATTHHTKLLQWLRKTDVLPAIGYSVWPAEVEAISGMSLEAADAWSSLTGEQKAFLRVLRRIALIEGEKAIPARTVVDAVTVEYGPIFKKPDQLAATVFRPLSDPAVGWITHSAGAGGGRGGKSGEVAATKKLIDTEVDLLPEGDGWGIPPDLKAKLQTPLETIYTDLDSTDTHTKGIALELLAIRMAIDLTLTPTRLRERGVTTGGAEVDLVAEGAHLHFSRWLLQCKNTKKVHVSALAKEVGMAVLLRAHVVVVVTTGTFTPAVETYAKELAATSPLQVVLVDGSALKAYKKGGATALRELFNDRARLTLTLKRPQVISETDT
jgi:hypothetical protein